jgi:alginate O-acetyltransferase complex protein AlgI
MSFISFQFAIFLAFGLLVFHLATARWRPALLLALSCAFYATWGLGYTALLAAVTIGVYFMALWIERCPTEQGKKRLAILGVAALLVLMFAFKSGEWLLEKLAPLAGRGGVESALVVVIPLGLSYYVFKVIGYLLNVYWEEIPAERNFVSLALYAWFFPQIVSGPIQRPADFFSQLEKLKCPDPGDFVIGTRRILFGLLKKVVVADPLGAVVAQVHSNPARFSSLELLFGAYCYSLQLYTDFSAVTDMALGIGRLFGIKGPENFDRPYLSANIQVFWRRWHMSLTSWLTDYLFMPLRMSLRGLGTSGLCLAILINMVAVGLWHGFKWTFAVFGIINGIFLIVSVLTLKRRNAFFQHHPALARIRLLAAPLVTFHLVVFCHIFFRAQSIRSAFQYITGLIPPLRSTIIPAARFDLSLLDFTPGKLAVCIIGLVIAETVNWGMSQRPWISRFAATPRFLRWGLYYALIFVLLYFFTGTMNFIYAQF